MRLLEPELRKRSMKRKRRRKKNNEEEKKKKKNDKGKASVEQSSSPYNVDQDLDEDESIRIQSHSPF